MVEAEWWEFDSRDELATQVADDIGFVIERAIEGHGEALLAVPGGSTPKPVFAELARRQVPWDKVTWTLTDDRLVARSDPLSNFGLLEKTLGGHGAKLLPLVDETLLADRAAAGRAADRALQALRWPLDLGWLGMGADGHTASIFPGPDFDAAVNGPRARRALGVLPEPLPAEAPVARVTLSLAALAAATTLIVVISGDEKRAVLERALKEGASSTLPIARVLAESEAAIDVYWSAS